VPIARSNGYKISYQVSGDGPAVVLHPGMFQDGAHWAHSGYTSALTSTCTVIAIDPLGLGASDAPHQAGDYSLERRVDSVTAVLDEVGVERAAFWGYSLGAMTGYAIAAPMRAFAERSSANFLSVSNADHKGCWDRSTDVLPAVLSFLAANAGMP
ncbi:alpha/beta fold hydrolase, partial [Nonomuraea sp. RK-328]|nr:alpha/beta fold hydrolase [Nonomuraea sp. RK-328]